MERYNSSTTVTNTFGYDAQNRLLTAYGKQYNYDPVGRMLKYEATSNNQTFNNNFPINAIKNTGYAYDANGNLTQRPTGTITQTLVWDSENHLSQVKNGSTVLESYTYDTDGSRVKKTVGSTSFYYPFAHYEISGTTTIKYYFFGGQRVAMKVGSTLTYLHGDHLGSTVLETNASGAVATDEKYFAFGKQRDSGKVVTDHRFTGQKEDGSGLMYYSARYYDPLTGLFVSPDTIVPDAGRVFAYNRAMYVYGNPLVYNDPSGHAGITGKCQCGGGGRDPEAYGAPIYSGGGTDQDRDDAVQLIVKISELVPYADTGNDAAVFLTGCGYSCRAGYEEPAGFGGRMFAGAGIILPVGYSWLRVGSGMLAGFRKYDEILSLGKTISGKIDNHHWVPQTFHTRLKQRFVGISDDFLNFTEPLEDGFHSWLHGKDAKGTLQEAYNGQIQDWLTKNRNATLDQFVREVQRLRDEYLELYQQYLLQQ